MTWPKSLGCALLPCLLLAGCGLFDDMFKDPPLTGCAEAAAVEEADHTSGLVTLNEYYLANLTQTVDSTVLQQFLDRNQITDSMRHVVKVSGTSNHGIEIVDLTLTLDSIQGQDTLVLVPGMEAIALRYLRIKGGRFKYVSGESHLPRHLIRLELSGSWEQIWTSPFALPQLFSYAISPGQLTDLGTALVQAQRPSCLSSVNLGNNKLTAVPDGMLTWDFSKKELDLSGNSICSVSREDSVWITNAGKFQIPSRFWPQNCPGP